MLQREVIPRRKWAGIFFVTALGYFLWLGVAGPLVVRPAAAACDLQVTVSRSVLRDWLSDRRAIQRSVSLLLSPTGGIELRNVHPGSPIAAIGLRHGDVVTRLDGARVRDLADLLDVTRSLSDRPPSHASLEVWRDGRRIELRIVIL